jgi:hypothetical protein
VGATAEFGSQWHRIDLPRPIAGSDADARMQVARPPGA